MAPLREPDKAEARAVAEDVEELKPEWVMTEGDREARKTAEKAERNPRRGEGAPVQEKKA